jgi:hypothetical protein
MLQNSAILCAGPAGAFKQTTVAAAQRVLLAWHQDAAVAVTMNWKQARGAEWLSRDPGL